MCRSQIFNCKIVVDTMTEDENNTVEIKCIFCEKELEQHEMVRFKGAISCRECAEKQKPLSNPIAKPFLYLAGVGCLVGMVNFLYFTIHGYLLTPIYLSAYIQPLVPYYSGMIITLVLFSLGLYYINRIHLHLLVLGRNRNGKTLLDVPIDKWKKKWKAQSRIQPVYDIEGVSSYLAGNLIIRNEDLSDVFIYNIKLLKKLRSKDVTGWDLNKIHSDTNIDKNQIRSQMTELINSF